MQPLRREDVFTGLDIDAFEDPIESSSTASEFENCRGFLLASALGLPLWAALILLCSWIW